MASPLLLSADVEGIKVETFGFPRTNKVFILLPFPRSTYVCTPHARQPTISALNPFALLFGNLIA